MFGRFNGTRVNGTRVIGTTVAVAALVAAATACSGDDTDSTPVTAAPVPTQPTTTIAPASLQEQVVEFAITQLRAVNMSFDEQCVREVGTRYSDSDSQAILDAGLDEQAVLSDGGNAITDELIGCIAVDTQAGSDLGEAEPSE